ncbi:MAG: hypothetical protein R3A48_06155 [Polyangiales bacterium]
MPPPRRIASRALVAALCTSGLVHAQTPAPAPAAAPPVTAVVAGVPLRLYGTLHAAVFATQGVETFGMPTTVAPTSAANPALLADPAAPELSFQVQQTRLGLIVGEGTRVRGQVEIDFAHFDQSSPTTLAFPRLRVASIEWRASETQRLFIGQNWDLFGNATSSLLSHSFNLVGTMFQAGNIGFMRHQLGWSGRFGAVELAAAIGFQGANTGPVFNDVEGSFTPTGSARLMVHLGPQRVVGASVLGTSLKLRSGAQEERTLALGGMLFADLTFGRLNLHAEAYVAQNLSNLGALDLAQGRYGTDVADVGGYLSAKLTLGRHALTAMAGVAAVLEPSTVVPAYTEGMNGAPGVTRTAAGPGITRNLSARAAWWYSPAPGLSLVLEPYLFATRFALTSADASRLSADRLALGASLGAMFQF